MRALLLIVVFSVCGYAWSDEPVQRNTKQQNPRTEQRGTEQFPVFIKPASPATQAERDYEHYEKIEKPESERQITTATIALACITGLLALFTGGLWIATYCLVSDSKETAKRQLRAYIWSESAPIENIGIGQLNIHSVIKNAGLTPAYQVHIWTNSEPVDDPLPNGFIFECAPKIIEGARYIVNPGSIHSVRTMPETMFTQEIRSDIISGRKKLYFWGEIRYTDAFTNNRITQFRLYLTYASFNGNGVWSWAYCDDGNDAT